VSAEPPVFSLQPTTGETIMSYAKPIKANVEAFIPTAKNDGRVLFNWPTLCLLRIKAGKLVNVFSDMLGVSIGRKDIWKMDTTRGTNLACLASLAASSLSKIESQY
jgi:hypothetical protein